MAFKLNQLKRMRYSVKDSLLLIAFTHYSGLHLAYFNKNSRPVQYLFDFLAYT